MNLELAQDALYKGADTAGFQGFVTITGVHGVVESQHDEELKKIHNRSYLSTPDGMPMVWLGRWNGYSYVDRVYGPELMLEMMCSTSKSGHRHFFFGGADGVAQELKSKLVERFPGLDVGGVYTPPFRPLTQDEESELFAELQMLKPHFFWVGLSTPKQEKFMHGFLRKFPELTKGWDHGMVMLGVGAAFDFHSGRIKQAPRWIQRSGFEWLFRVCMDPKRLFKRYAVANTYFISKILPQIMGWKKYGMPR
ncbi:WecB/TagA/CpsF family glycosyltransferase [Rubritalea halochordaticola]|uniref:WecB/TagA/CpsF family glycosyltransferase n=1 Tax=Rubritalea halochordaticola TaxID=714537 RepID=UPI0031FE148B